MAHPVHPFPDQIAPDSRLHPEPPPTPGIPLPVPSVATPLSRLAAKDFGSSSPPRERYGAWLASTVFGWAAFAGVLLFLSWALLALVRGSAALFGDRPNASGGLGEAIGNIVAL